MMTIKEQIYTEINQLTESELEELYQLIQRYIEQKPTMKPKSVMAKLKEIKIDGPIDLAENHDQYVLGEGNA